MTDHQNQTEQPSANPTPSKRLANLFKEIVRDNDRWDDRQELREPSRPGEPTGDSSEGR